jgi:hypothetical protein
VDEMGGARGTYGGHTNAYRILVWKPEGMRHLEGQCIDEMIILKLISKIGWEGMHWINLAQDRDKSWACVNTVMKLQDPENVGSLLTTCETRRLSGRTLVYGVNYLGIIFYVLYTM